MVSYNPSLNQRWISIDCFDLLKPSIEQKDFAERTSVGQFA